MLACTKDRTGLTVWVPIVTGCTVIQGVPLKFVVWFVTAAAGWVVVVDCVVDCTKLGTPDECISSKAMEGTELEVEVLTWETKGVTRDFCCFWGQCCWDVTFLAIVTLAELLWDFVLSLTTSPSMSCSIDLKVKENPIIIWILELENSLGNYSVSSTKRYRNFLLTITAKKKVTT